MRSARGQRVDLLMYLQAVPMFLRHLSILVAPLLAAVVALLLEFLGQTLTDPVGGIGAGLYGMLANLAYLLGFGIAIVQASNAWRGYRSSFDASWDEARPKLGNILLAAIGFQFVIYVAELIGQYFGTFELVLIAIAAIFLIYSIPAAAIGGLPGGIALSGSIRAVRAQPLAAIVLGIVFVLVWTLLPQALLPNVAQYLSPFEFELVAAALNAILLGYLAFPFAKQYDDVAFRGFP